MLIYGKPVRGRLGITYVLFLLGVGFYVFADTAAHMRLNERIEDLEAQVDVLVHDLLYGQEEEEAGCLSSA